MTELPEGTTAVLLDENDREQLMVFLRDPESGDLNWLRRVIDRYDRNRRVTRARAERPGEMPAVFHCDPDESGGYAEDDPKHEGWHSVRADLWDLREKGVPRG